MVGDGGVGKTALSVRFTEGKFKDDYKMTIGVDFSVKMMHIDNTSIKLQIWDTGGQEQFSYVRPLYYKGSVCGLIVFDKTNRQTFTGIGKWFKEVYDNRGTIPLILVGNKVDLPDIQVTAEEGRELAKKYNTFYFESSAKSGKMVNNIFENLVRMVLDPNYVNSIKETEVEVAQPQTNNEDAYKKYNTLANQATAFFQADNKKEALDCLKQALDYAKKANFQDGARWCEDQIAYISKQLHVTAPSEVQGFVFLCQTCNKYYTIATDGNYMCPKCSTTLIRLT